VVEIKRVASARQSTTKAMDAAGNDDEDHGGERWCRDRQKATMKGTEGNAAHGHALYLDRWEGLGKSGRGR